MKFTLGIILVGILAMASSAMAQDVPVKCGEQITQQFYAQFSTEYSIRFLIPTDMPNVYILKYRYFDEFTSLMIRVDTTDCKVSDWDLK